MEKVKVIIWGIGNSANEVYDSLDFSKCELYGVVDRSEKKHGAIWKERYHILFPEQIDMDQVDYVIISAKSADSIEKYAIDMGISSEKIILFWKRELESSFIKKEYLLERENTLLKMRLRNAPYEYGMPVVNFMDNDELFRLLIEEHKSMARFGDGEFEIIRGKKRGWFQHTDNLLAGRLLNILTEKQDKIVLAIADNFGNLDKYTDDAADAIREYLSGNTRQDIMKFLPLDCLYGDAYITRFYLMYRNKTYSESVINSFKKLWNNRSLFIVENKYSRMGVGNDLFEGAKYIRRILCPNKNAFDFYDSIKNMVINNVKEDDLILISLGQTATVLAYDLGMIGLQAIDIGQIDTEYEWYLRKSNGREEIKGKSVAEIPWWHEPITLENNEYAGQIIAEII